MKKFIGSKSRLLIGAAFLFAILSISNSCTKSTAYDTPTPGTGNKGGPGTNEVWIQNMAFDPATITVNAGTAITWTNKDTYTHTVTMDNGMFSSGNIITNGIYSNIFPIAGTYTYHCSIHPSMIATVIVKDVIPAPGGGGY